MAAHAPARAPQVRPPFQPGRSPVAPQHERPQLRVVGPRSRRQLRTGPTFALGAVIAFVIAFAVVACQVLLVQGQQRLDDVNAGIAEQTDRYQQLRLEVAELESPGRIVDAATDLGMVPPPEVVYLTPTGAISVPADGAAAPVGLDATGTDLLAQHAATRPNLEGGG